MADLQVDTIVISVEAEGTTKSAKEIDKVTTATKTLGKTSTTSALSTKGLGKSLVTSSLFARRMTRAVASLGANMSSWFTEANDYVESMNLFNVAMGSASKGAQEFVQKAQDLAGLDSKEVMEYMGTFNMMLEGFGHGTEASAQMSQQLTQLAYDLSSLYNVDVSTAFNKLSSGMAGQVKGLRDYGISVTVASLKETALRHNINLSVSAMTEAQKATLRYVTIMENSKNVQGDLARTILTPANSLRILNNQWTLCKRAMGQVISVIAVKVIPWFMALIKIIRSVAESLASLFGYELPELDYSGLSDASGYADDLDDSLGNANKSAKKLQRTLMGFDEINRLDAPDTGSGGSGTANNLPADLGLDLSEYNYDFFKGLDEQADEYVEKLKKIFSVIKKIAKFIALLVVPIVAIKKAKELYEKFKLIKMLLAPIITELGEITAPVWIAIGVIAVLVLAFKNLYENSEEFRLGIKAIGEGIKTTFKFVWQILKRTAELMLSLLPEWLQKDIKSFIQWVKNNWGEAFLHCIPIISQVVDLIKWLGSKEKEAEKNGTTLAKKMQEAFDSIYKKFDSVCTGITRTWNKYTTMVGNSVRDLKKSFGELPEKLKSAMSSVGNTLKSIPSLIAKAVGDAWKSIKEFPNTIKKAFSNIFDNFHVKLPHITWVYGSSLPADDWKAKILSALGLDTKLPKLDVQWYAQGGLPPTGQMFVARESGAELVGNIGNRTAVMNNDQIVSAVAQGVAQAVASVMGTGGNQEVVVNVDGKKLFDVMVGQNNAQVRRTGSSPLLV